MTKKSIIIDLKAHSELTKLTESLNMNYGSLVEQMIYYFKKTGIDPKDAINKNPSIMVAALDKRIVSFLKVQERDILKPLRQDVFNYQNSQKVETTKLIDSLNKFLNFHNEKLIEIKKTEAENNIEIKRFYKENFNVLIAEQQKNRQAILALCNLIDGKNNSGTIEKLKSLFS